MAPHDLALERAPLPVPGVRPCVGSGHERSSRPAREALAGGGVLGANGRGRPPSDGGAHRQALGVSSNTANAALQSWVWVEVSRPPAMRGIRSW